MKKLMIAGAALALIPQTVQATVTGNDLYVGCANADSTSRTLNCTSYIRGVIEGAMATAPNLNKMPFDVPEEVTMSQLADVLVAYLKAHPEKRHWPAAMLVLIATTEAFPSRSK